MAKKLVYSDEWGQIVEYKKYRGKNGRFLKDKSRAKIKHLEIVQYRILNGKRFGSPIYARRRGSLIKTTWPGLIQEENGSIKESLRATNILTEVDRASRALVNIRGQLPDGSMWRHQFEKELGEGHESEQLINAIYWELASFGLRMNYNINLVRFIHTSPRDARKRAPLKIPEISVQLFS